jgi:hypothetical protein
MTFGILLFQLSMCRIFVTIIKGDLLIASFIVIVFELFLIAFYVMFEVPDLKDILKVKASLTDTREIRETPDQKELRDFKQKLIEAAYLHPFEKYNRRRKAQKTARKIQLELDKG